MLRALDGHLLAMERAARNRGTRRHLDRLLHVRRRALVPVVRGEEEETRAGLAQDVVDEVAIRAQGEVYALRRIRRLLRVRHLGDRY